jgi:hypothetical protein
MTTPASDLPIQAGYIGGFHPESSKNQASLFVALMNLQNELDPIKKTETNPHLSTTYANLTMLWNAIREPLATHGLLVLQEPHSHSRGAMVTTTVVHVESGEWRRSTLFIPARKADAQAFGSALSYCRRYSLLTVLSLMTTDDDGHAATLLPTPEVQRTAPPPAAQPEGTSDKGWQNWAQSKLLQLTACEDSAALAIAWTGMQPELKKAPDEVRFGLTSAKDQKKASFTEGGPDDQGATDPHTGEAL